MFLEVKEDMVEIKSIKWVQELAISIDISG
jgi:hypothetical protein